MVTSWYIDEAGWRKEAWDPCWLVRAKKEDRIQHMPAPPILSSEAILPSPCPGIIWSSKFCAAASENKEVSSSLTGIRIATKVIN